LARRKAEGFLRAQPRQSKEAKACTHTTKTKTERALAKRHYNKCVPLFILLLAQTCSIRREIPLGLVWSGGRAAVLVVFIKGQFEQSLRRCVCMDMIYKLNPQFSIACINPHPSLPPPQLPIPAYRTPAILALNALHRTRPTHTHMPTGQYSQFPLIRQTHHTLTPSLPPSPPKLTIPAYRTPAILALNAFRRTRPTHTHMPTGQYSEFPLIRQTHHTLGTISLFVLFLFLSSSSSTGSSAAITPPSALAAAAAAAAAGAGRGSCNAIDLLQDKNTVGCLMRRGGKEGGKEGGGGM